MNTGGYMRLAAAVWLSAVRDGDERFLRGGWARALRDTAECYFCGGRTEGDIMTPRLRRPEYTYDGADDR